MHRLVFSALAALAASVAVAQEARRPDPAEAKAKVPPPEYRSAFEGYRAYAEEKVAPWRESNDAVKPKPAAKPPAAGRGAHR